MYVNNYNIELEEVKQALAIRKNQGSYVPLELFRSSRSVTVSGISSGLWCEQQVEYRHLHPYLRTSGEWLRRSAEGMPVQRRTEVMKEGASIHLRKGIYDIIYYWRPLCHIIIFIDFRIGDNS